jgi:hypothetical protein
MVCGILDHCSSFAHNVAKGRGYKNPNNRRTEKNKTFFHIFSTFLKIVLFRRISIFIP